VAETRCGAIEYVDSGQGLPVLVVHGVVGGCDHGSEMAHAYLGHGLRTINVSRFGYVRSPLPEDSSPAAQADLYAALLDVLRIEKVVVAGTSAGTSSSLQFALRHPERCTGLVLWSLALPTYAVPGRPLRSAMRAFFGSDWVFWAMITYMPGLMHNMMGVPAPIRQRLTERERAWLAAAMRSFLPISLRVDGIMNDVCVSNPGMNDLSLFAPIEAPALIIHAADDPMRPQAGARQLAGLLANAHFMDVSDGGHLLLGHFEQVKAAIRNFIAQAAAVPV
jgi:pimeloyl-ACP methyl ester carboxylesterase